MEKEFLNNAPEHGIEERITKLISEMQEVYGGHYDDLNPEDQVLWNELTRFARIEKEQPEEKRKVVEESIVSFLNFLKSNYTENK